MQLSQQQLLHVAAVLERKLRKNGAMPNCSLCGEDDWDVPPDLADIGHTHLVSLVCKGCGNTHLIHPAPLGL